MNEEYKITSSDNIINKVDNSMASKLQGYENGFIEGYYKSGNFYISIIQDKNLIVKKLNLNTNTYDEFLKIQAELGNATILYVDTNTIYIYTYSLEDGEYYTNIYSIDIDSKKITKIDTSKHPSAHAYLQTYYYNKYVIVDSYYEVRVINTKESTIEKLIDSDDALNKNLLGIYLNIKVKNGKLYLTYDNSKEYDTRKVHEEFIYNFNNKKLTKLK